MYVNSYSLLKPLNNLNNKIQLHWRSNISGIEYWDNVLF